MKKTALTILCASVAALATQAALAQNYPAKGVTVIIPFPPAGVSDLVARLVAERLGQKWKQPVVVQNRPGAGSMIGLTELARATPDGYTIGIATSAISQAHLLSKDVTYKVLEDFAPISLTSIGPYVMAISPSVPAKTLPEFIKYAKSNPGKLNYASTGPGPVRFVAEGFMAQSGVKLTEIPYKGSAEMSLGLLAGESHVTFDSALNIKPHAESGKLVALVAADKQRNPLLPNVPASAEAGMPNFQFTFWNGMLAPARTPANIVSKVSADVVDIMKQKDADDLILSRSGAHARGSSPAEFKAFIESEVKTNTDMARTLGLKPQ